MDIKKINIDEIQSNNENPRYINEDKFEKLIQSIKDFPEMLEKRPLIIDENNIVLGGNMRLKALKEIGIKKVPVIIAKDWSEEKKKEFIIKDNVGFGSWDWDVLANEWELIKLEEWGLEIPNVTETEKLSKIEFEDVYYTPKEKPNIRLSDCLDLSKYNEKIKAIEKSPLKKEQKEVLKMFAYRFIRIDFESVANYYYFNASEEEQKVIERLRLVLCDNGLKGFIDDDLLRVADLIQGWSDD